MYVCKCMYGARSISTPPGRDASPSPVTPQPFAGAHLYLWVETGTARVEYLAQEHNTGSPARAWSQTTHSGVKHPNHKAILPPTPPIFTSTKKITVLDNNKIEIK